jgi:hypothetical protein
MKQRRGTDQCCHHKLKRANKLAIVFNLHKSISFVPSKDESLTALQIHGRFDSTVKQNYCQIVRKIINPLTPELNPSAQRSLTRFFTEDFAS